MERWREYEAGTLTPPCVVQHDILGSDHLIWVWHGAGIVGPVVRPVYDEAAVCAEVLASLVPPVEVVPEPAYRIICEDGFEVAL